MVKVEKTEAVNNDYPKMLYKSPGDVEVNGGTVKTLTVDDAEGEAAAITDGWFNTVPEAFGAAKAPAAKDASWPKKG